MKDKNITFVIFAYNEEERIEYVLRCFKDYGKLMIIDNYSTDNTIKIAEKYTDLIYQYKNPGWVENKEVTDFVFDKVHTDWVYFAFVDELAPKTLLKKLVELSIQDKYKVVYIARRNYHYGLKKLYLENAELPRFFKKGAINFENNKIHGFGEIVVSKDEIFHLPMKNKYSVHHFSTYNISKFEINHNKYSDIEAKDNFENNIKFSPFRLLLIPIATFFRYYFINSGWKSGWAGFIMTLQYCFFLFNTQAKLWELENDINLETIEQKYDKLKEEMLNEGD
ncbi:MAG: glycosyltransferase [Methanobacterium sp.]|uniref:glycosyltransferase n=1 Tax=Methanobacterium sp. TaxID=2164 RepID=UPI003D65BDE0|nr:glycosyltransferase [Methanobacterium sp.]